MSPQPYVQQTVDTTETAPNTAVPPAAELSPSEQQQTAANQKVSDQKPQPAEAVAPPPPEKPEKEVDVWTFLSKCGSITKDKA